MLLGLHLVTLTHGQQSVKVLGLGAYVVQQTGCKCFWVLKRVIVKHMTALQKVYNLFYLENKSHRLLNVEKNESGCSSFTPHKNLLGDR